MPAEAVVQIAPDVTAMAVASLEPLGTPAPPRVPVVQDLALTWAILPASTDAGLATALARWKPRTPTPTPVTPDPADLAAPLLQLVATSRSPALDAIDNLVPGVAPHPPVTQALAYASGPGSATELVLPGGGVSIAEAECLSVAIYHEARGESEEGQIAVAQVILNRVDDRRWPDTICGVVFENEHRRNACQFSFACDGKSDAMRDATAGKVARRIAADALAGRNLVPELAEADHYHATYVAPSWAPKMQKVADIGAHVFYEEDR